MMGSGFMSTLTCYTAAGSKVVTDGMGVICIMPPL